MPVLDYSISGTVTVFFLVINNYMGAEIYSR